MWGRCKLQDFLLADLIKPHRNPREIWAFSYGISFFLKILPLREACIIAKITADCTDHGQLCPALVDWIGLAWPAGLLSTEVQILACQQLTTVVASIWCNSHTNKEHNLQATKSKQVGADITSFFTQTTAYKQLQTSNSDTHTNPLTRL